MESTTSTVLSVRSFFVLRRGCSVCRPGRAVLGSFKFGDFLYCQFIISTALAQLLSRHFRLLWTLLQGAHPLDLFLALIHCLPRRLIFSGVHYYLLEPSTLFSFSGCITRSVSHLPVGRLGVYCILDTPAVSWAGLGCPFRSLLYLFYIQSVR